MPLSGHHQADRAPVLGSHLADDLALIDDGDTIAERKELVQLLRDEQDRGARLALFEQQPLHALNGADVQPARRLDGDEEAWARGNLACQDQALKIANRNKKVLSESKKKRLKDAKLVK